MESVRVAALSMVAEVVVIRVGSFFLLHPLTCRWGGYKVIYDFWISFYLKKKKLHFLSLPCSAVSLQICQKVECPFVGNSAITTTAAVVENVIPPSCAERQLLVSCNISSSVFIL